MDGAGSDLRVVTWNVWWRFGPWRQRQRAIETVLLRTGPDVLALQEAWAGPADARGQEPGGGAADLGRRLADLLGLHLAWSPNRHPRRWQRRIGADGEGVDVGLAVLSRWPLLHVEEQDLPDGDTRPEGRTVLGVVADHPSGPLPVLTTHLTSHPARSALRVEQARSVAAVAARISAAAARLAGPEAPHFPPVVAGDLNAEPDSDEVRHLSGSRTAPAVDGLVLLDAWRFADPADPGWTWRRENAYLVEGNPDARIDHVLVGLPSRGGLGAVRGAGLVGHQPVDGVWPSDHAGVRVDLRETVSRRRS